MRSSQRSLTQLCAQVARSGPSGEPAHAVCASLAALHGVAADRDAAVSCSTSTHLPEAAARPTRSHAPLIIGSNGVIHAVPHLLAKRSEQTRPLSGYSRIAETEAGMTKLSGYYAGGFYINNVQAGRVVRAF
jgi:hypothetical protein